MKDSTTKVISKQLMHMKKLVYTLGIIAASALAFSACQKEKASPEVQPEVETEVPVKMVTVSFTAEKVDAATKTQAVEGASSVSYEWTTEDASNIKLFTVDGEGALSAEVASPTINIVSPTSLTITTTVPENSTTTFRAILCKSDNYTSSGDDYTSRKPKISPTQAPNGTNNYDPNADILVSDDLEVTVGSGETSSGAMEMVFRRQVVVNKMTLKNLVEGEKVSKVVISSDKNLTGYLNGSAMSGQGTEISLNYDDVAVPAGGQFPVYFVSMENAGHTLTVTVTTDQYTYEKTFGPVSLTLGSFTLFGVGLPAGTPISDLSGYYLIGSLNGGYWQLMDSEINTSGSNHYYPKFGSSVDKAAGTVAFSDFSGISDIDKYLWQVEKYDDKYSIKSVDTGKYLSYSGTANAAQAADTKSDDATKFDISLASTTATIGSINVSGRVLRYNSGSPRFAFYTSGQQDIFMIPATYDSRTKVTLSFADDAPAYNTSDYGDFTGQSVTVSPNETAITENITWSIVDTDNITSSFNTTTGALVLNGSTGSATVTATFAGDATYRNASASYTITVTTAGSLTYYYEEMTSEPSNWTTETYIVIAGTSVLNTSATSSWGGYTAVTKESDGSVKMTADLEACEVAATGNSTDGYRLQFVNATTQYYLNPLANKSFTLSTTASGNLDLTVSSIANHDNSSWLLRCNGASGYRWYSSATGTQAQLYKKVAKN